MGHYDLNRMGWQQFEHMVQALAKLELGNGVRPFGSGQDGQRDATFEGRVTFPVGAAAQWDGYGVIQMKHNEKPVSTTIDGRWFLSEVRGELKGWLAKKRIGAKVPKYLLFATNVSLSGTAETGGKDQFDSTLEAAAKEIGLEGWFVWDYNEIRTMLDTHTAVRQRYLEAIVTGDFLAQMEALLPRATALEVDRLAHHAVAELVTRQWVRTGDAGYDDASKVALADIAIDLPCRPTLKVLATHESRQMAARTTIVLGDHVLSTGSGGQGPHGVVLVGGPGQGKSTIAQVIAHAYRVAFLQDTDIERYGKNAATAFTGLRDRLRSAGIPNPTRRRWPIVLELAKAGTAIAREEATFSLLRYLAETIVVEGHSADPSALLDWMRSWPVCLVLDGLDEVPDVKVRARLMDAISALVTELSAREVDLLVVATTRPRGYRGEFDDALPCSQLELLELTEDEALSYSEALTRVRAWNDPDLAEQITERLLSAVHERVTQRLMTTPLQVTIMTALAEDAVDLPSDRFELFNRYYRVVYDRELSKSEAFSELRSLRQHIDHLHEQAGLKLQSRTEQPGRSDAMLTKTEIGRILQRRLSEAGFDPTESETLSDRVLKLSTERVVMLVSRRPSKYEFEVRSLQEYMAARALTEDDDEAVLRELQQLLPATHWRNSWLLAAGRLLKQRERLATALVKIVTEYDTAVAETPVTRLGASLAGELYLDNLGMEFPAVRRALLECAMGQFADTAPEVPRPLIDIMDMAVAQGGRERDLALSSLHELARANMSCLAANYLHNRSSGMDPVAKQARSTFTEGRRHVRPETRSGRDRAQLLARHLSRIDDASPQGLVLAERLQEDAVSTARPREAGASYGAFLALEAPAAREMLAIAVYQLAKSHPDVAAFGADLLRTHATRYARGLAFEG